MFFVIKLGPNLKRFGKRSRDSESGTPGWNSLFWRSPPARTLQVRPPFNSGRLPWYLVQNPGNPPRDCPRLNTRRWRLLGLALSPSPGFTWFNFQDLSPLPSILWVPICDCASILRPKTGRRVPSPPLKRFKLPDFQF